MQNDSLLESQYNVKFKLPLIFTSNVKILNDTHNNADCKPLIIKKYRLALSEIPQSATYLAVTVILASVAIGG